MIIEKNKEWLWDLIECVNPENETMPNCCKQLLKEILYIDSFCVACSSLFSYSIGFDRCALERIGALGTVPKRIANGCRKWISKKKSRSSRWEHYWKQLQYWRFCWCIEKAGCYLISIESQDIFYIMAWLRIRTFWSIFHEESVYFHIDCIKVFGSQHRLRSGRDVYLT